MLLTFISSCNENEVENEKKKNNGKNINESCVILRQYSAAAATAAGAGAYMPGGRRINKPTNG